MRYRSGEPRPETPVHGKQPRRVAGFAKVQVPHSHKPKVRRNARQITELQANQRLKASPWDTMEAIKTTRVDVDLVNFKGWVNECQSTDTTPRLVKPAGWEPRPKPQPFNGPRMKP